MSGRLGGKIAIVTGGGSGMGRAGAEAFAVEGAVVVVADIDPAKAEKVVQKITAAGGRAQASTVDVADSAQVQFLAAKTVTQFGCIDVLYHCAADVHFINTQDRCLLDSPKIPGSG